MPEKKDQADEQPAQEPVEVTMIRGSQLPNQVRRALRLLVRRANAGDVSPGQVLNDVGNILNTGNKN